MTDVPQEGDRKVTTCSFCGEVVECEYTTDPYAQEIAGDESLDWECDHCVWESARDI